MLTARELSASLFGAYRLARLDAGGLRFFDVSERGFWRSFYAAALVAPPYFLMLLLQRGQQAEPPGFLTFVTVETIAYIVAWSAFPLLMFHLSKALQRENRYIRFIVVYNWAAVLQSALYLPIVIFATAGLLPEGPALLLGRAAVVAILAYSWFVARKGLDISGLAAVGVVVADLALSIVVEGWTDALLLDSPSP